MIWFLAGVVLASFYGWLWCVMIVSSDADDVAMREWERQQAEWRRDDR